MWRFKYSPSKLCADVKVHATEWIGNVGFAGHSEHMGGNLVSIVPGPVGAKQVVHRLVFSGAFNNSHLCSFVVTKLCVLWSKEWLEKDWGYDGCPCFKEVNKGVVVCKL